MTFAPSPSSTSGGKQLFLSLDALRGIAALAVVGFHAHPLLGGNYVPRGYLAVDLFFLISGVVIAHAYEARLRDGLGLGRFFVIRMVRFAPFYLFGTLFGVLLAALLIVTGSSSSGSWSTLAADIVLGTLFLPNLLHGLRADIFPLNVPGWSLFYEIAVNLLYVILLPLLSNRVLAGIVLTSAAALSALDLLLTGGAINSGPLAAHLPQASLRVVFAFSFGVLIYRKRADLHFPTLPVLPVIALAIVPYFLPLTMLGPAWDQFYVMVISPLVIATLLKAPQGGVSGAATRASLLLGTLSYGIYATHHPLIWITNGVQDRLALPGVVTVIAFFAGLIAVVLLFDRFIDRPLRRALLNRWGL